ncbi:MAG: hypothetical protein LBG11_05415 [Bifidobacteriaceae bacterium]|jgi:hypothetical protein|nr:hypothetical protein [Bifidobacteriaceae bacterium]
MDHSVVVSIPQVVLMTGDQGLAESATAAIWEAGVAVQPVTEPSQLDAVNPRPRLLICGHDVAEPVVRAVEQLWPDCRIARAALGEMVWGAGGASGIGQCLVLPEFANHLTRLVESTFAAKHRSHWVALIGAHGGAGTSCLAVAMALRLTGQGPVRLAGLNRAGAPIGPLLGLEPPIAAGSWTFNASGSDDLRPITVQGIELLSGQAPDFGHTAWQVRQTLEAWEAGTEGGHTILDTGSAAPGGTWRVASWADRRIVVARADPTGAAALAAVAKELEDFAMDFDTAVRNVRGGLDVREVVDGIGGRVFEIKDERTLVAGLAHGLTPGERAKGKLALAAAQMLPEARPEAACSGGVWGDQLPKGGRVRHHRRRRTRPALPAFNPAAFAEEW